MNLTDIQRDMLSDFGRGVEHPDGPIREYERLWARELIAPTGPEGSFQITYDGRSALRSDPIAKAPGARRGRKQKFFPEQLTELVGESIEDQATALGCSTATIKKLRSQHPAYMEYVA